MGKTKDNTYNFSSDNYQDYVNEISKYNVLSDEEFARLFSKYHQGSQEDFDTWVKHNLKLLVAIANSFKSKLSTLSIMDIIGEGNIALMDAIRQYDIKIGKFSSYAYPAIERRIRRLIETDDKTIKTSIGLEELKVKYKALLQECNKKGLGTPSDVEICYSLNITSERLETLKKVMLINPVSLNATLGEGDDELESIVGEENRRYRDFEQEYDNQILLAVLKKILNHWQYYIVYHHIIANDMTLEELSGIFGYSKELIRLNQTGALNIIKKYINIDGNKKFSDILESYRERKIDITSVRVAPLNPDDLLKYIYIKDDLEEKERKVLYFKFFGELKCTRENTVKELGLSKEELTLIEVSLNKKLNSKFSDISKFYEFSTLILRIYGSIIFELDLIDAIDISFESKETREDLLNLMSKRNIFLSKEDETLLTSYFLNFNKKTISKTNIEKDVYLSAFGIKEHRLISKTRLCEAYKKNLHEFDDEQSLFIEGFILSNPTKRKLFETKYPNSTLPNNHKFLINRLELLYYGLKNLTDNIFGKEAYIYIKENFPNNISKRRIMLLDLY